MREQIRKTKSLLDWEDRHGQKICVKNADGNYHVLKPLAKRLRDSNGEAGMLNIPPIASSLLELPRS